MSLTLENLITYTNTILEKTGRSPFMTIRLSIPNSEGDNTHLTLAFPKNSALENVLLVFLEFVENFNSGTITPFGRKQMGPHNAVLVKFSEELGDIHKNIWIRNFNNENIFSEMPEVERTDPDGYFYTPHISDSKFVPNMGNPISITGCRIELKATGPHDPCFSFEIPV